MNGKGSRPRNNHSARFRANFDEIRWLRKAGLNVCCGKPEIYCKCDAKTKKEAK